MAKRTNDPEIDLGNLTGGNEINPNQSDGANNGNGSEAIDPASASNAATAPVGTETSDGNGIASGSGRKRRADAGRKRGPRGAKTAPRLEIDGVAAILLSSHAMLAAITQTPEFALEQTEATQLAKAIDGVSQYYDVAISGKAMAWINLTQCVGLIYGARLFAIRNRRAGERMRRPPGPAPQTAPKPGTVEVPTGSASNAKPAAPASAPLFMPSELNGVDAGIGSYS